MEHGTFDLERLQVFLLGMTNRAEIARKGNLNIPVAITASTRDAASRVHQGFRILTLGGEGLAAGTVEGIRIAREAATAR